MLILSFVRLLNTRIYLLLNQLVKKEFCLLACGNLSLPKSISLLSISSRTYTNWNIYRECKCVQNKCLVKVKICINNLGYLTYALKCGLCLKCKYLRSSHLVCTFLYLQGILPYTEMVRRAYIKS